MYTQVAEKWLAQQPRLTPLQREFLEKALGSTNGSRPRRYRSGRTVSTASAAFHVGEIRHKLGLHEEAEAAFRQAEDGFRALADGHPEFVRARLGLAGSLEQLGGILADTNESGEAERAYRSAEELAARLVQDDPSDHRFRRALASIETGFGSLLASVGRQDEANAARCRALAHREELAKAVPGDPMLQLEIALDRLTSANSC